MTQFTRRDFLVSTAAAMAASTLPQSALAADAGTKLTHTPEKGAKIQVLRWRRFVEGDEKLWMENTKKFTALTGVPVQVDSVGWEDVRAKSALAAQVGSGPDIVVSWFDDAQQFPDKLMDVTDVADYLGNKYGGWYDVCKTYGIDKGHWVAIPLGVIGNAIAYRASHVKAAGFDTVPNDLEGFYKLCEALKAKGTPAGFAMGHAVGDGSNFAYWMLWSHGGMVVNPKGQVVLNSPETIEALKYGARLSKTFIPGVLAWSDPSNNMAFLAGQISLTANGISLYYAAKNSKDPKQQEMAADIEHTHMPVGKSGKHTELGQYTPMMPFKYTKYPNAVKAYLQFMMEADQYNPWMEAAIGYVCQPLKAYENNPIWKNPKARVYGESTAMILPDGYDGPMGPASAAVMADYIVVDMFAQVASGSKTPEQAAAAAAERAKRYYKA